MIKRQGGVYPDYDLIAYTVQRQKPGVKFPRGHYPFALSKLLDNPATMVVLRHPMDRTISTIRHIIRHGGRKQEEVIAQMDAGRLPVEDNLMTRYLGTTIDFSVPAKVNPRWFLDPPIKDPTKLLDTATDIIPTIDYLGLADHLAVLEEQLRADGLDIKVGIHNASKPEEWRPNESQRQLIAEKNTLDLELYEHACREFALRRRRFENVPPKQPQDRPA
jgi:hypothetical protein